MVIACAGGEGFGTLLDVPAETFEAHMRLNLTTAVVTTRETLPALIERGGGSSWSPRPSAGLTRAAGALVTYTTAKTALLGFVRSVAVDYGRGRACG